MKSVTKYIAASTFFAAAFLALSAPASAGASRESVCHTTGSNGNYILIEVSEFAVTAHRRHGDGLPGEPIGNNTNRVFGPDCSPVEPTPVVAPGFSGLTSEGQLRFRQQNSGNELYLGKADVGASGNNRNEASCDWTNGSFPVSFSFDGANTISALAAPCSEVMDWTITPACGNWDTMDVLVLDRSEQTGIAFENVYLNGFPLGNFGTLDVPGAPGFSASNWTISAFDFSQPWTISGELVIENFSGSAELNRLQLTAGCFPGI